MKNKFLKIFVFLLPITISLSSCSDFRKAVGKEKVIPDEFSVAFTPSLVVPPGYKIDPEVLKNNDVEEAKNDFKLTNEINIDNKNEVNSFSELFGSKSVPKDIRKIVDEETLGISLSERTGIQILFGDVPETGIVIDNKKEALRIRKNRTSGQKINSTPSPALDINSGKALLIK
ncbi:hypothetical protein OA529_02070 [Alphaproteobacteria bacterium]|nr:hypothetical protein [Alphaproteobacteria bacterium]